MSSRPPGQDRFSQMTDQAQIIARKKAEIEAKLKATSDEKGGHAGQSSFGSISVPNNKPVLGKPSKNRWGFKGKRNNSEDIDDAQRASKFEVNTSSGSHKTQVRNTSDQPLTNQFSNDGSFLEQFRKLKQAKDEPKIEAKVELKIEAKVEPKVEPKVELQNKSVEDDWYKAALARAKRIAQNMSAPPPVSAAVVKQEPEIAPNRINPKPSGSEYGNSSIPPSFMSGDPIISEAKSEPMSSPQASLVSSLESESVDEDLPMMVDELASMVAVSGDHVEEIARARNVGEEALAFLFEVNSPLYLRYRRKVDTLRKGFIAESTSRKEDADTSKKSKRKSRWGDESDKVALFQPGVAVGQGGSGGGGRNPVLIQYAIKVFGTTDLEPSQWKQCEDQLKMNQVYNELLMKQKQNEVLVQQGRKKYEYDSDEDTEGGTWEHKARKLEMQKTQMKAEQLTDAGQGNHHIGDFLPPDELSKFMAKFQAIKSGETYVEKSDYAEHKLNDDNLGFKMMQRMGWSEGRGLGSDGQGITAPINQGQKSGDKKGLGTTIPHDLREGDDEFDAYRKRMMVAYRFRPNPLNNPRRAYY